MSDTTIIDHYDASVSAFGRVLATVAADDWTRPTPCSDWDVRALVAHVVDEHRWVAPLLDGRTIADVAPTLADDPLGADPHEAWRHASDASVAAVRALDDVDRIVHLSFGDVPASVYLEQLTTDHVVHLWDLARAIGGDEHLDPVLVDAVLGWFGPVEAEYRAAGAIGERGPMPDGASARTQLLAMTGRDDGATASAVTRFDEAFGRQDLDAVMAGVTGDCVFETTSPPDGVRHMGAAAVRAAFAEFFAASPAARFDCEQLVVAGHRAVLQWRYSWGGGDDEHAAHVRGVDLLEVRGGLVSSKRSYVKG